MSVVENVTLAPRKVVFLYAGQVEEEGPPDQLFSDPSRERTRSFLRSIIEAKRM